MYPLEFHWRPQDVVASLSLSLSSPCFVLCGSLRAPLWFRLVCGLSALRLRSYACPAVCCVPVRLLRPSLSGFARGLSAAFCCVCTPVPVRLFALSGRTSCLVSRCVACCGVSYSFSSSLSALRRAPRITLLVLGEPDIDSLNLRDRNCRARSGLVLWISTRMGLFVVRVFIVRRNGRSNNISMVCFFSMLCSRWCQILGCSLGSSLSSGNN